MTLTDRIYITTVILLVVLGGFLGVADSGGCDPKYDSFKEQLQFAWVWMHHGHGVAISTDLSHFIRDGKRYRVVLPEGLK